MTPQEAAIRERVATYETDAAKHNWTRSRCQDDRVALLAALDAARAETLLESKRTTVAERENAALREALANSERENGKLRTAVSSIYVSVETVRWAVQEVGS